MTAGGRSEAAGRTLSGAVAPGDEGLGDGGRLRRHGDPGRPEPVRVHEQGQPPAIDLDIDSLKRAPRTHELTCQGGDLRVGLVLHGPEQPVVDAVEVEEDVEGHEGLPSVGGLETSTVAGPTDTTRPHTDALEHLEGISFAWSAGYDLGVMHGRVAERALIEQERRLAAAGRIVRRLAEVPALSDDELARRREGRARTAARIAGLRTPGGRPA